MLGKSVIQAIFRPIKFNKLRVEYWDGTSETFGSEGKLIGTLTIHTEKVLAAMAKEPETGFAEAYLSGEIDFAGRLHDLVLLAVQNQITTPSRTLPLLHRFVRGVTKATSIKEQRQDIHHHYDLGNDFYRLFLDPSMTYSCAYFRTPKDSLEQAQRQKVSHTLKKLNLKKGERLLDIGSGWGELILEAATTYGVTAHGITMSEEQVKETNRRIKAAKIEKQVSVSFLDYRELSKTKQRYDKIVSVGMFEHVGRPNLAVFMNAVNSVLEPGGLLLLHFITQLFEGQGGSFTMKYIFPGGYIPSVRETLALLPERNFRLLDAENLRLHYALTLDHWADNFEKNLDDVRTIFADPKRFGERWGGSVATEKFIRMWRLYLHGSAANFRGGAIELHQFLISKGINNDLPLTREGWYR